MILISVSRFLVLVFVRLCVADARRVLEANHEEYVGGTSTSTMTTRPVRPTDTLSKFSHGLPMMDSRKGDANHKKKGTRKNPEENKSKHESSVLLKKNERDLNSSAVSASASTCTNPLELIQLPNTFSTADYISFREQCTDKCNADGYCCTSGFGGCNRIPCNEGCHIAFFSDSLAECKAECERGNDLVCYYEHSQSVQVGYLGYYPWWPEAAVGKCWDAQTCGCPFDDFGNDCDDNACSHGCDMAFESDIRDFFFNGEDAIIDPHIGLSPTDLTSAISSLQSHVDGSTTLTNAQLRSTQDTFEANSEYLNMDFDSMNNAFALVDAYESKYGGLWTQNGNDDAFIKEDSNDGYTLDRIMVAVMQAILDEVYQGTLSKSSYQVRIHDAIVENCQDYLRGRYWQTSSYFPGSLALPTVQSSTVYSVSFDASVNAAWGRELCFETSPAIHPTGYYLPPGGVAWIDFPSALVNKDFQIQVGANDSDFDNKDKHWRMDRITCTYDVKASRVYVASPLGGGIYIKVPYLANYDTQSLDISGDVIQAPFFSTTSVKSTTRAEWNAMIDSTAPWADFESDYFMQTVPTSWITSYDYDYVKTLMENRDASSKALNFISGFPDWRRNKHVAYLQPDIQIRANSYGVGYPQVNTLVHFDGGTIKPSPNHDLVDPFLGTIAEVEFHELGHCVYQQGTGTFFSGEIEAIVNFPYAHIMHTVAEQDFDYAFSYTMGGATGILTPDMAAVDWMVTVNFREGNEMEKDYPQEFQYQPRGYGKYADLYTLFGKDMLYNFFYALNQYTENNGGDTHFGNPDEYDYDDWHTLQLSIVAGVNLAPLMHFWGIHPEDSAKLQASMDTNNLSLSSEVYDLISQRLDMIPKNRDEFLAFFRLGWPGKEDHEPWECTLTTNDCGLYIYWMDKWDETIANKAVTAGQAIIDLYYDTGYTASPVTAPTPTSPTPTSPTPTSPTPTSPTPTSPTPTSPTPTSPTSSSCVDSPLRFKLTWGGKTITRYCTWVENKQTVSRCASSGVSAMCPSTCGKCSTCVDSDVRFKFTWNGKTITRSCAWVAKKQIISRCAAEGVYESCRQTCGEC